MSETPRAESVLDHAWLLLPHLYTRDMRALPVLDARSRLVGSVSSFGAELGPTLERRPAVITLSDATGDVLRVCDPPRRGMPLGCFWGDGSPLAYLTPRSGIGNWSATGSLADGTSFAVAGTRQAVTFKWNGTQIARGDHRQPGASPSGLLASAVDIDPRAPAHHRAAIVAGFLALQRQWAYERESAQQPNWWLMWSLLD